MGSDNLQPTGKVSALVPEYELMFLIWYNLLGFQCEGGVIKSFLAVCSFLLSVDYLSNSFCIVLMRNLINLTNTKSFVPVGLLFRMIYAHIKCDCEPSPNTCKSQLSKISRDALNFNISL